MSNRAIVTFSVVSQGKKIESVLLKRIFEVMKTALKMSGLGDVDSLLVQIVDEKGNIVEEKK